MLEKMTPAQLAQLVDLLEELNQPPHPLLTQLIDALVGREKTTAESLAQAQQLYDAYPRKAARAFGVKAFQKALKKVDHPTLLSAVRRFAIQCRGKEPQYIPHAATWCNQERYLDGIEELEQPAPMDANEKAARDMTYESDDELAKRLCREGRQCS